VRRAYHAAWRRSLRPDGPSHALRRRPSRHTRRPVSHSGSLARRTNERTGNQTAAEGAERAGGREGALPRRAARSVGRFARRGRLLERVSECDVVHTMYGAGNNWPISFGSLASVPVQARGPRRAADDGRRCSPRWMIARRRPAHRATKQDSAAAYNVICATCAVQRTCAAPRLRWPSCLRRAALSS
jgi:hypothetical protein